MAGPTSQTRADDAPPPRGADAGTRAGRRGRMPSDLWSTFGEEFRSLRTRVVNHLEARHKVILVTSALPSEGKTTVSAALARSLAQMEWRTILVDCDLRKPGVHGLFGVERAPGAADLMEGKVGEEEAVGATDSAFLDLLTAGTPSQGPAELLQSEAAPALLKRLAARYDYVVVDSPPLTSITDTHLLARCVDGILFVVNGRVSPRDLVKAAREQLVDRPVLGVVLNGISTPKKYGYYY